MDMILQPRSGSESTLRVALRLELTATHLAGVRQGPGCISCSPTLDVLFWLLWVLGQHCCSMRNRMSFYCRDSTSCRRDVWKWMKLMRVPASSSWVPGGSDFPHFTTPFSPMPTLLTSGQMQT